MTAWWTALDGMHQVFYLIAIPFTVILVLQMILLLIGLGGHDSDADHDVDHDFDHDLDHDLDHDFDHDVGHDAAWCAEHGCDHDMAHDGLPHDGVGAQHGAGLRMLTLRGIVAFMAVCGWVGVSMLDLGLGNVASVIVALLAGFAAMLLVALFMKMMTRLQQAGNLDVHNAVGLTGEVYIPIRPGQKGKVSLLMQERLTEMDAVSTGDALPTGRQVRVVRVTENNVLVVEAVD